MKITTLFAVAALSISCFGYAEDTQNRQTSSDLQPLNGVRVSMQRMLTSGEGRYFMSLYAGITHPHATLIDLMANNRMNLRGDQKGDQIQMTAPADALSRTGYEFNGVLNANSGVMKGTLQNKQDATSKTLQFEPAFKVANKPVFIFKFYGMADSTQSTQRVMKRVDVLNKNTGKVVQSLTGFSGFSNSIGYMDINFDGYYDVILSDVSQGRDVTDKRYIYWMYNPKTNQFQRSSQLEKIVGFPELHGEKQQIDFGNGQVYQVTNGLLNRL